MTLSVAAMEAEAAAAAVAAALSAAAAEWRAARTGSEFSFSSEDIGGG